MNKTERLIRSLIIFIACIIAFPRFIFAYIDPGTGSYVIQVLIAAFIGISFAVKLSWKKIKAFLSRFFKRNVGEED